MRGASQAKGEGATPRREVESGDADHFLGAVLRRVMGEGVGTELVATRLGSARPAAELQVT